MTIPFEGRRTFEIGRVVERTFGSIGHNFVPFLAMAVVFAGLPQLVLALIRYQLVGTEAINSFSATSWTITIVGAFFTMAGAAIMQAGIMQGTIADLNGDKVSLGAMFQTGLRYLLPMIGIVIVYYVAVTISAVFFLVPGLIVAVMFIVASPAAVIERTGVFGAFARSRELTRNHRWMIFFLLLIFAVVGSIFNAIVFGVFAGVVSTMSNGVLIAQAVVTPISATVFGLIAASGVAAIYYELRTIKEGIAPESLLSVFD